MYSYLEAYRQILEENGQMFPYLLAGTVAAPIALAGVAFGAPEIAAGSAVGYNALSNGITRWASTGLGYHLFNNFDKILNKVDSWTNIYETGSDILNNNWNEVPMDVMYTLESLIIGKQIRTANDVPLFSKKKTYTPVNGPDIDPDIQINFNKITKNSKNNTATNVDLSNLARELVTLSGEIQKVNLLMVILS